MKPAIHVMRSAGTWEASWWDIDEQRYWRKRDSNPDTAARLLFNFLGFADCFEKPRTIIHERTVKT